ncbi:thioesterase II family protein [Streptomyces sp. NPDC008222]|uniref:thioesterase II family protein n=1 Tax=Streptomyces sp. NPDC008222 TaxID=3364820 RepID=UPI0036E095C2
MRDDERWFRRYQTAPPAAKRLVCFPHAGGSANYFLPVARALDGEVDVLAVQYPGRSYRRGEPCADTIGSLADAVVEEAAGWLDRPVTLFGHSMGALVAFEVAWRLEVDGRVPLSLLLSGRRAPSTRVERAVRLDTREDVIAELTRLGGTDPALLGDDVSALRTLRPVLRADYEAVAGYEAAADTRTGTGAARLTAPILVYAGDDDPEVTEKEAAAWQRHTTGEFEVRIYRGGHFYPVAEERGALEVIRTAVARCPVGR